MTKLTERLALMALLLLAVAGNLRAQDPVSAIPGPAPGSTADHRRFDLLRRPFASGEDVTRACLRCHTEASHQVMQSIHWTWEAPQPATGQTLGKRHVINSFCGNVAANEARCTSCHAGQGWERMIDGPPQEESAVDCLVCHDRSGQYARLDNGAGRPALGPIPPGARTITGALAQPVDLNLAAMSVGAPGRETCGQCHFNGGGGDNVKHGDLSSVLIRPPKAVDVHMSPEGQDFTCSTCHRSEAHRWPGSRYAVHASDPGGTGKPGARRDVATCQSCHGERPHPQTSLLAIKLNDHTASLACQTCHIPSFARGGVATKTLWDWSTAGQLRDGKPFKVEAFTQGDGTHRDTYLSTKGDFAWGENVVPHYDWFDGQMRYTSTHDTIDPSGVVSVNSYSGTPHDGRSRIWPFKRMEGRQAYDAVNRTLVHTHVYGPETDTAFWTNFDWGRAIAAGTAAAGQPFSGELGFVDTEMFWPITHMVAPAQNAVRCGACHSPGGRLATVAGVRIPGTNPWGTVDLIGAAIVLVALLGIAVHAALRLTLSQTRPRHD